MYIDKKQPARGLCSTLQGATKDHIGREILAQARFPERWGYMSNVYTELQESSVYYKRKMEMSQKNTDEKNVVQCDSERRPFPKTSSQVIGWKSSKAPAQAYGIRESRARRKCDFLQVLQWPYESL